MIGLGDTRVFVTDEAFVQEYRAHVSDFEAAKAGFETAKEKGEIRSAQEFARKRVEAEEQMTDLSFGEMKRIWEGYKGAASKDTALGLMPDNWQVIALGRLIQATWRIQ